MPGMKTPIPLQEKMAELEYRVGELERKLKGVSLVETRMFGNRWQALWKAFDNFWSGEVKR